MQGVYLNNTGNVPFEAANTAKYGNTYPGMQAYITAMNKYEPKYIYNAVALQGWQSAALIAAGIKAAGTNLTQANVVSSTNKITNFTAGGHLRPRRLDEAATPGSPGPAAAPTSRSRGPSSSRSSARASRSSSASART